MTDQTFDHSVSPDSGKPTETVAATPQTPAAGKRKGFLKFPRSWREVKQLGWKFVVGFILFYLVRDLILYVLIPYLIIKGVISL
ncbi:MAG: hypothetical protein RBT76_12235 [candidate division Zixibacteria bacterium]|nr:hypothetical protein [candidate division Zixibacteria bacterium]